MDVETSGAIDRLRNRIDALEFSLRLEFQDGLRVLGSGIRQELREQIEETRRHAIILNESTRDDIRLVAEAVANLSVKVGSLRR
jgi:hypothetical protein